jgi:hypothetical protein
LRFDGGAAVRSKLMKRKLIVGLAILAAAVATPILCISLLGSGAAQQDNEITEGQESGVLGHGLFCPTHGNIRDPEFALRHGILGYVELTWEDDPPLAMHRGETWNGTWFAHFVSHTCEVTEAELHIEPGGGTLRAGTYYHHEDGTQGFLDFSSLLRYDPDGVFRIKAGETMAIAVTIQVPADLARSVRVFPVHPLGIWIDGSPYQLPGVTLLSPDHHEVQVIDDSLPSDDH